MIIDSPIARGDIPALCERVRVLLAGSDAEMIVCEVAALGDPDAVTVEAVARLQLTARQLRREVHLLHASDELRELLALTGLHDVVPLCPGLSLEPRGQSEEREQARGVEEEGNSADPIR